jgi:alkylhydroperoxidase family enzyme
MERRHLAPFSTDPLRIMSSALANDVRQTATDAYGVVPNLFKETNRYTGIPGAVYVAADAALMDGNLTPPEQQAVLLTMARYHDSRYDAVVHARMALDAGLPPDTIEQLLAGEPVADDRLRALVEATLRSCEERGWLDAETLGDLQRRGVGRGELYEIFAFIGLKTFTGFTDHLADPEVDGPLKAVEDALDHVPDEPDTIERQRLFMG